MRNGAQTDGAQTPHQDFNRWPWSRDTNGLRAAGLAALASVIGATQAKLRARPDFPLTINSPDAEGTTNSSSVRARLKPLKTLA
jgi:hypothetical protein